MRDCSIGIDLGGTKVLLRSGEYEERFNTGPAFSPQDLLQSLKSFIARNGLTPTRIGVAVPGLVDNAARVVACDVLPSFAGWEPTLAMADLHASVIVLNDVKAALLEEMHDAPHGYTGGIVMVGTAIGAAFMAGGKPILGVSGWAGELGYLPLVVGDQVKRLDDLAGGSGIAAICGLSPALLAQRAAAADPMTLDAISAGGRSLGLGLAAVINLLNPSRLAVGGGTIELPGYWQAACSSAAQNAIPELWRDCTLVKVKAGAHVVVRGAIRAAEA
jgi:glucokinase